MHHRARHATTASLVIVEAGASPPATLLTRHAGTDRAVVQQAEGEALCHVMHRAQRIARELFARSVGLTDIIVVTNGRASDSDMTTRELLGVELLQLEHASGARLSFLANQGNTVFAERLLGVVGRLLEGTRDQSIHVTFSPSRHGKHRASEVGAVAA